MMKVIKFMYEGKTVEFEATINQELMVNATHMAKLFNKNVKHFLRSDHAKAFIKVMENKINLDPNGSRIIENRGRNGIYFDRRLALKFAAWLSPQFEYWVFNTIDSILYQEFKQQHEVLIEKEKTKQEKEEVKKEMLTKYPELSKYFELEKKEKQLSSKRAILLKEQVKQLTLF